MKISVIHDILSIKLMINLLGKNFLNYLGKLTEN